MELKEPFRWNSYKQHQDTDRGSTEITPVSQNPLDFFCNTPVMCRPSYRVASVITLNSFEQFCLLVAILGECIHRVRCLQAANFLVRTYSQRHRQKQQTAALQYGIGSVTEPLQHGFMLRPAVARVCWRTSMRGQCMRSLLSLGLQ